MIRRLFLVSTILVTSLAILVLIYLAALFVAADFDTDFLAIDACYDEGGVWDEQTRSCKRR